MIRKSLDRLYAVSGFITAASILAIMLIVLAQVLLNFADYILALFTGESFGLLIPSYATFAGYALASATFFALAYTLRAGGHIRVTLVTRSMPPRLRRLCEVAASVIATGIGALLTLHMIEHAHDAWRFGDMSFGLIPVPLWISQCILVAGSAVFTVACLDTLHEALRGIVSPSFANEGDIHPEDQP
jgi:TRAP-type C4-dicarboxylate transport system permease small subunit